MHAGFTSSVPGELLESFTSSVLGGLLGGFTPSVPGGILGGHCFSPVNLAQSL